VGVLDEDLRKACLAALGISRAACRQFALSRTWEHSARQFVSHVNTVTFDTLRKNRVAYA
jgi:hypothetical protein